MSSTVLIAGVALALVFAFLLSSFIRHLRWEERLFLWRVRIFVHCLMFCALVAGGVYLYLSYKHKL